MVVHIFLSRVSIPMHAERDTVLPYLSVCLWNAGTVSNEWTYRHNFYARLWASF